MIDEDLTPDEARRLRAHMDTLPESVEPARDLWPGGAVGSGSLGLDEDG